MSLVNKTHLAEILGKSQQTLTTWQKNGMPIFAEGSNGQANQYKTEDVIQWLINREIGKLTVDDEGRVHDYEAERARLTHHQANKTELESKVLKGQLIHAETVEQVQGDMVSSFRSKILAIPTKAAHSMIGLDDLNEAKEILKEYLYEALSELADYEPRQYGIVAQDSSNGGTTTGTDNE